MSHFPKARSKQLVIRELDNETIVYDVASHHATCLDIKARRVWDLCDGRRDTDAIFEACRLDDREACLEALHMLSQANLLTQPIDGAHLTSRRDVMGQMAGAAAAVTVMSVPTAVMAASIVCGSWGPPSSAHPSCGNPNDCDPIFSECSKAPDGVRAACGFGSNQKFCQ